MAGLAASLTLSPAAEELVARWAAAGGEWTPEHVAAASHAVELAVKRCGLRRHMFITADDVVEAGDKYGIDWEGGQ